MRNINHSRLAGLLVALVPACAGQEDVAAVETSTSTSAAPSSTGPTGTGAGTTTTVATSTGTPTTTTAATSTGATGNTSTATNTSSGGTAGTTSTAPTSTGGSASTGTTTSDAPTSATGGATSDTGTSGTSAATDSTAGQTSEPVVDGLDPETIAPGLDGFYWEGTCTSDQASDARQCEILDALGQCNNNVNRDIEKMITGDAAKKYIIEIEVRGLLGSRCYTGGVRRAGDTPPNKEGPNDGLYIGGTVPANWWNTYELHVMNAPQGEPNTYYLNAYYDNKASTIEFDPETCTMEEVLEVGYSFELPVMGNSTLMFRLNDQNCQAQMNCGLYEDIKECTSPRTIDLTGMEPAFTMQQPVVNQIGGALLYPQWAYFDVKSIKEAE